MRYFKSFLLSFLLLLSFKANGLSYSWYGEFAKIVGQSITAPSGGFTNWVLNADASYGNAARVPTKTSPAGDSPTNATAIFYATNAFSAGFAASTITSGTYKIWIKANGNNSSLAAGQVWGVFNTGGTPVTNAIPTTTSSVGPWFYLTNITFPNDTNKFSVDFYKIATADGGNILVSPLDIFGIFITTDSNEYLNGSSEYVQTWNYSAVTNTATAIPGNYVKNSSFDFVSPNGNWTIGQNGQRHWYLSDSYTTDDAYDGKTSLAFYFKNAVQSNVFTSQILDGNPVKVRGQKVHTISLYAKATTTNCGVRIQMVQPIAVPSGYGLTAQPTYTSNNTITTNWARYSYTTILIDYPYAEYVPEFIVTCTNRGIVYLDAVQIEEGSTTNAYAPRYTKEMGIEIPYTYQVVWKEDTNKYFQISMRNTSGAATTNTVHYLLYNARQDLIVSNNFSMIVANNSYTTNNVTISESLPLGYYRVYAYLGGQEQVNAENDFAYIHQPDEDSKGFTNNLVGFHGYYHHAFTQGSHRAGLRFWRDLSPGAYGRIAQAEPFDNGYASYPRDFDVFKQYDMGTLNNLSQVSMPHWICRSFMVTTNWSGLPTLGETVTQGAAVGTLTWMCETNDVVTGLMPQGALQIDVTSGTFTLAGGVITGSSSGATMQPTVVHLGGVPSGNNNVGTPAIDKLRSYASNWVMMYTNVDYLEILNEPNGNSTSFPVIPLFGGLTSESGVHFTAIASRELVRGVMDADPTRRIVLMAGGPGSSSLSINTNLWWLYPEEVRTNTYAVSFHWYSTTVDTAAESFCNYFTNLGVRVWNTETGYKDYYGTMMNNPFRSAGVPVIGFKSAEFNLRTTMSTPRMMISNILESVGTGVEKYFYYDNRLFHTSLYDYTVSDHSHYTGIAAHDAFKPKIVPLMTFNWIFNGGGGVGRVQTNGSKIPNNNIRAFKMLGRTNSHWLAVYSAAHSNQLATGFLSSANYDLWDIWGNAVTFTSGEIPFGQTAVYVRGIGKTYTELAAAFTNCTFSVVTDTNAPNVIITEAPRGTISALEKDFWTIRWVGADEVDVPFFADSQAVLFRYRMDAAAFTDWGDAGYSRFNVTNMSTGSHTFTVEAKDRAGNTNGAARTFVIP